MIQLSKFDFGRLIDGSKIAAENCMSGTDSETPDFALIVSCFGRKIVLSQRVEEELDSAKSILGENTVMTGFYSYGEISPNGTPLCANISETLYPS